MSGNDTNMWPWNTKPVIRVNCVIGWVLLWFFDSLDSVSIWIFVHILNGKTRPPALSGVLTLITPGGSIIEVRSSGGPVTYKSRGLFTSGHFMRFLWSDIYLICSNEQYSFWLLSFSVFPFLCYFFAFSLPVYFVFLYKPFQLSASQEYQLGWLSSHAFVWFASWRHLTGGRPWNCSASCFKCLASSSSILSVNILFASATAPQATDFTSPFSFFFMNLRRLDLSIFLSLAQQLHSPSPRGVFCPRLSSWCIALAWWLFYNVYDIKNKTYVA